MTDVLMPKLSDSMEEGTILTWLKADGEHVEAGEDLVEIETDKATVTHAAEHSGTLTIIVPEGGTAAVGAPIASVGVGVGDGDGDGGGAPVAAEPAETLVSETPIGSSAVALAPAPATNGALVTPLARRAARVHGVALDGVRGTGPRGRITRADVLARAGVQEPPVAAAPAPAPSPPPAAAEGEAVRPLSRLQQTVARRMAEAKATVPHFQVQTEVAMDAAIGLRADLKAAVGDDAPVPSFNDMVVKAAALALREHPLANGSYTAEGFALHDRVNVGVAVAADGALVVPTVFDADDRSLGAIARTTGRLAAAVRDGTIAPADLAGGTFTVSNLGMYGMTAITPVINPPQAAILGVGALRPTLARAEDGTVVDRTLLILTLSCDHRILYGAEAATFLARVRALLEEPLRLTL